VDAREVNGNTTLINIRK